MSSFSLQERYHVSRQQFGVVVLAKLPLHFFVFPYDLPKGGRKKREEGSNYDPVDRGSRASSGRIAKEISNYRVSRRNPEAQKKGGKEESYDPRE